MTELQGQALLDEIVARTKAWNAMQDRHSAEAKAAQDELGRLLVMAADDPTKGVSVPAAAKLMGVTKTWAYKLVARVKP